MEEEQEPGASTPGPADDDMSVGGGVQHAQAADEQVASEPADDAEPQQPAEAGAEAGSGTGPGEALEEQAQRGPSVVVHTHGGDEALFTISDSGAMAMVVRHHDSTLEENETENPSTLDEGQATLDEGQAGERTEAAEAADGAHAESTATLQREQGEEPDEPDAAGNMGNPAHEAEPEPGPSGQQEATVPILPQVAQPHPEAASPSGSAPQQQQQHMSASAPVSPRHSIPNSPTLFTTRRREETNRFSLSPRRAHTDPLLAARLELEMRNAWMAQAQESDARIMQARTRRQARNPTPKTSLSQPVSLINTNNVPPAVLARQRGPGHKTVFDGPAGASPELRTAYSKQLNTALDEQARADKQAFQEALWAAQQAADASVQRQAAEAAAASQRQGQGDQRMATVQSRGAEVYVARQSTRESKLKAKHDMGSARVQGLAQQRTSQLQASAERRQQRSALAAAQKGYVDDARAALANLDHEATQARLSRTTSPTARLAARDPGVTPHNATSPTPVWQRYQALEGQRGEARTAKAQKIALLQAGSEARRSGGLDGAVSKQVARQQQREARAAANLAKVEAEREAAASHVKAKHDAIHAASLKRATLRQAQELDNQVAQRSHVMVSNWTRQLQLMTQYDKRLPTVHPEVASAFDAYNGTGTRSAGTARRGQQA